MLQNDRIASSDSNIHSSLMLYFSEFFYGLLRLTILRDWSVVAFDGALGASILVKILANSIRLHQAHIMLTQAKPDW